MKRALRIAGWTLAALVLIAGAAFALALVLGERKLQRQVFVKVVPVPYASGTAVLKHGRYLFETRGCISCHGPDGSGRVIEDGDGGLHVRTPNITRGPGGVVAQYTEADWVRAIRHGVDPKGRALLLMPSDLYNRMSDADFAALVAYVRGLPPIAGEGAAVQLPATMKALYGIGVLRDASEKIRHGVPPPPPIAAAATLDHGRYVAHVCMGCHGETLTGGRLLEGPPGNPAAANLTPGEGTVMTRYDTFEKFAAMMRTGKRPDGSAVRMPFDALAAFNDTDLAAIYAYLRTLAPKPAGAR